jgi:Flp pilus assembly protein TadG
MKFRSRPGQALAEFALCSPVLLLLLLGIVDIGWLYNRQLMLTHATREGARLGTLGQSETQIRTAIRTTLQASGFSPLPTDAQLQVSLTGGKAHVAIAVPVPTLFAISGPEITLGATTDMRLE